MKADIADVAVVGGGVVGLASAVALQQSGRRVVLVDRNEPGSGCSSGNAGIIATSFVQPLSSLGHLLSAPAMLANPTGPLAIRPGDLAYLAPWLLRFAANALPARRRTSIDGLKLLNGAALPSWRNLLRHCGASALLVERGMIEVARTAKDVARLDSYSGSLRAEGIAVEALDSDTVQAMEPGLTGMVSGGQFHSHVAHVRDPLEVSQALLSSFIGGGGTSVTGFVRRLSVEDDHLQIETDRGPLLARKAVVAAGLWSRELIESLGAVVPIRPERGYHLMLPAEQLELSRPLSFSPESFIATPMSGGIRLAGTVELASADAEPNWKRADQLLPLARRYLPSLRGTRPHRWMGCRPSLPDSLPAIGRLAHLPNVIYAFGHQHLGLTQAAITSECVAALVNERHPPIALGGFTIERFS